MAYLCYVCLRVVSDKSPAGLLSFSVFVAGAAGGGDGAQIDARQEGAGDGQGGDVCVEFDGAVQQQHERAQARELALQGAVADGFARRGAALELAQLVDREVKDGGDQGEGEDAQFHEELGVVVVRVFDVADGLQVLEAGEDGFEGACA